MYQINSNSVTSKISDDQKEVFNALLAKHQENGHVITSFRDFISLLLDGKLTETPETPEIIDPFEDLQTEISEYAERNELTIAISDTEIVKHALTQKHEPKVEIQKETETVEIEKDIEENQLLVTFTPEQHECFEQINANRNRELTKQGKEEESKEFTALGLMFNPATVNNFSDHFYTGI